MKLLSLIALICIVVSASLFIFYFLETKVVECTTNPLAYAEERIYDEFDATSVYITLHIDGATYDFREGLLSGENRSVNLSGIFED